MEEESRSRRASPHPSSDRAPTRPLDILVVEDDATLREVLHFHFESQEWQVRSVGDGDAALDAVVERRPDVVVLDVMLPGRSGLEICAELRARFHPSPGVVMVTARDDEVDVILGFEVGADDYVIKPCRPREIVARVRALARRIPRPDAADPGADLMTSQLARLAIVIDEAARRVSVRGAPLRLTPSELALLIFLAREPGRVFTRMELLERVFESTHEGYARNVDCHVARLRRKFEAAGVPAPVHTRHGFGYYFDAPDETAC